MKYKFTEDTERKLAQFVRSNYAELFELVFSDRNKQLNKMLRVASPESYQQVQGRALELDDLLDALKIIAQEK